MEQSSKTGRQFEPVRRRHAQAFQRRQLAKSRELSRFASQVRQAPSQRHIATLAVGMVAKMGGLDALCTAWKAQIDAARPGSRFALSSFAALVRLLEAADQGRQEAPLPSDMTDADLEQEISVLLADCTSE